MSAGLRTPTRAGQDIVASLPNPLLEVRDTKFSYGEPVLDGVSFSIDSGELLTVLGPNGVGKSTLLRLLVGTLTPASGTVWINGRRLDQMARREAARLIGYVPQDSNIRFPLTALEFVLQGRFAQGRLIGFESEQDANEAASAMELTQTIQFAERRVTELSGGERQRVMLARAIASQPRLLILDEPVANLDIAHQVKVFELVKGLTMKRGMSAVVVTHELNLAAEFATSVLLLKSGRVTAFGSPREVMNRDTLGAVFETDLMVDENPTTGAPRITLTRSASRR